MHYAKKGEDVEYRSKGFRMQIYYRMQSLNFHSVAKKKKNEK